MKNEKSAAAQAALEKFAKLPTDAQQFILGYMACYEQMSK